MISTDKFTSQSNIADKLSSQRTSRSRQTRYNDVALDVDEVVGMYSLNPKESRTLYHHAHRGQLISQTSSSPEHKSSVLRQSTQREVQTPMPTSDERIPMIKTTNYNYRRCWESQMARSARDLHKKSAAQISELEQTAPKPDVVIRSNMKANRRAVKQAQRRTLKVLAVSRKTNARPTFLNRRLRLESQC